MKLILEKLRAVLAPENIKENEPMKNHTSFKVGGPADLFLMPQTKAQLKAVLEICRASGQPFLVIGNGSNLLVRDGGYRGIIIETKALNRVVASGETITAEAGISLKALAAVAQKNSLTGLEFASGIPGTLGGAVTMNAGAYDGEMKQVIASIEVVTNEGSFKTIPVEACAFGYRSSILQQQPWVLVGVSLRLKKGDASAIKAKMDDLNARRRAKQPLNYPSAGSTFRRPEGYFAGKLIQDAGFKGRCVGGAQVSEKHSGFVINKGDATADDILALITLIQTGVQLRFGVELKTEVIVIGED